MRLLSYDMPKDWNYFLFGDSHIGANLRDDKGFKKLIDMMHSPYKGLPPERNRGTDHGDIIEAITVDDKRFSFFDSRPACITSQKAWAIKEYRPIADKLFTVLDGNHPWKLHKFGPITHEICKELGVSFGTTSARLTFKHKGKLQFKHFAAHGAGGIRSVADSAKRREVNLQISLEKKFRVMSEDCLLKSMGHTHQVIISRPSDIFYVTDNGKKLCAHHEVPTANKGRVDPDYCWHVNTGSFLKIYGDVVVERDDVPIEESKIGSGYAERAMYPPAELGFCVALIRDNQLKDVIPEYI